MDAEGVGFEATGGPFAAIADADRLRDLLEAFLAINSDLSLPDVLRRIVEAAVRVVGSRFGALGVLSDDGKGLGEFVTVGISAADADRIGHLPEGRGILGLLILEPQPLRLENLSRHPDSFGFPPNHPSMKSFLGVPIRIRDQVFGNLYLTEKVTAAAFSEDDERLAVAVAGVAAIAIDNARLHARLRDVTLIEDRERIAADLHDTVIQRLFAAGLALQSSLASVSSADTAARIEAVVDELDETIRQVRSAIFALQSPRAPGRTLRGDILSLVGEAGGGLGFEPHLLLDGPIDSAVPADAAQHLLNTLREALSNVVRHAGARRVDVRVTVQGGWLQLEVHDDGRGLPPAFRPAGRGLSNMGSRAERLGGSFEVAPGAEGRGTSVRWQVPVGH